MSPTWRVEWQQLVSHLHAEAAVAAPKHTVSFVPGSSLSLAQLYLHGVTRQIPRHAASAVLDGETVVVPFEGGRVRWVEFGVVVCRNACQCVRHPS